MSEIVKYSYAEMSQSRLYDFCVWAASQETDDCILWPFALSNTGYAPISVRGKRTYAHRVTCSLANGEPPSHEHTDAAHSCRNRHCVNPRHIRWATRKENFADKIRDGTHNKGSQNNIAKLNETQVLEIRENFATGGLNQTQIAKQYGVTSALIGMILLGTIWTHVGGPIQNDCSIRGEDRTSAKLTENKVRLIRTAYENKTSSRKELAVRFCVARQTIDDIVNRKTWTHVE